MKKQVDRIFCDYEGCEREVISAFAESIPSCARCGKDWCFDHVGGFTHTLGSTLFSLRLCRKCVEVQFLGFYEEAQETGAFQGMFGLSPPAATRPASV